MSVSSPGSGRTVLGLSGSFFLTYSGRISFPLFAVNIFSPMATILRSVQRRVWQEGACFSSGYFVSVFTSYRSICSLPESQPFSL